MTPESNRNVSILKITNLSESRDLPEVEHMDSGGRLQTIPNSSVKSNEPLNILMICGVSSSVIINSRGSELSPVKWCNHEVGRAYLGSSGWVQVEKTSDNDNRHFSNSNNKMGLSNSTNMSKSEMCWESKERKYRPINLPISLEKDGDKNHYKLTSPSHLNLEPGSSQCITPIISPPPGFKDTTTMERGAQRNSIRRCQDGKPLSFLGSANVTNSENVPETPVGETNFLDSKYLSVKKFTPLSILEKRALDRYEVQRTKFLKNNQPLDVIHSGQSVGSNLYSSVSRFDETPEKRLSNKLFFIKPNAIDSPSLRSDDKTEFGDRGSTKPQSRTKLEGEKKHLQQFTQTSPRKDEKGAGFLIFSSINKQFSSSSTLSSSSSTSSLSSTESLSPSPSSTYPSLAETSSVRRQNFHISGNRKVISLEDCQQTKNLDFEDCSGSKVRRSRSLQLPKERCSNSKNQNSFSPSCASGDQMSNNYFSFEIGDEEKYSSNNEKNSAVCGRYRDARQTSRRTREISRKAAEEVQIISDFLSRTRSRAAARNLLLHRYLNRPEDDSQKENRKESEYGVHFLGTYKKCEKKKFQTRLKTCHFSSDSRGDDHSHDYFQKFNNFSYGADYKPPAASFTAASSSPLILSEFSTNVKSPNYFVNENVDKKIMNRKTDDEKTTLLCVSLDSTNCFSSSSKKSPVNRCSVPSNGCLPFQETDDGFNKKAKFQSMPIKVSVKLESNGTEQCGKNNPETWSEKLNPFNLNGARQNAYLDSKIINEKNENYRKFSGKRFNRFRSAETSLSEVNLTSTIANKSMKQKNCRSIISFDEYSCQVCEKYHEHAVEMKAQQEDAFDGRPESAPVKKNKRANLINAHQRSLSLPKSFRPEKKEIININKSNLFSRSLEVTENNRARTASDDVFITNLPEEKKSHCLVRTSQRNERFDDLMCSEKFSSSLPNELLGFITSKSISEENVDSINSKEIISTSRNKAFTSSASGLPESALYKIKKNLLLRMKSESDVENHCDTVECIIQNSRENIRSVNYENIATQSSNTGNRKSRFGSLIWRSNRNRKKLKKIIGNTECSSGDSGIQVEYAESFRGEDSESHDADHPDNFDISAGNLHRVREKRASARKRTRPMSDLKEQRLFNCNNENCYYMSLISDSSFMKGRFTTNNLKEFGSTDRLNSFRRAESSEKEQLKRSLSHPTELNKSPPLWNSTITFTSDEEEQTFEDKVLKEKILFESDTSIDCLINDRKEIFEITKVKEVLLAEALWDHVPIERDELQFGAGDVIEVLDTSDRNWWWGTTGKQFGYFPSAFVRLRVNQKDTVEDCLAAVVSGKESDFERRKTSISFLSDDQVRSSIIKELLKTERDFVKVLKDVTEGYVAECRKRTDMFTGAQIKSIFSNLEDLLIFQKNFFHDLEARVDFQYPYKSCIGEIFFNHRSGFRMYSEYCNSHPMAIATLQELYKNTDYNNFFEACRLMRGLMKIPLDGYLLTPIQRICKYPLQLAELLKYTKSDHPDYEMVRRALETMKKVATLINERKRKMESLEKLAAWQRKVDGWQGDDLIALSSQLIHQGDVLKITSGVRSSNITLFLFDHQIVYCKKDLLKRNFYAYKGRIFLDSTDIIDLPDGKSHHFGVTVKHGVKIYDHMENKWLVFCCSSDKEKTKWLDALFEERKLVAQDKQEGLELSPATRKLATMFANAKSVTNKPKKKFFQLEPGYAVRLGNKTNRKVGTWFTFGGGKKSSRINLRSGNSSLYIT